METIITKTENGYKVAYKDELGNVEVIDLAETEKVLTEIQSQIDEVFDFVQNALPPKGSIIRPK